LGKEGVACYRQGKPDGSTGCGKGDTKDWVGGGVKYVLGRKKKGNGEQFDDSGEG